MGGDSSLKNLETRVAELERSLRLGLEQWENTFNALSDWVCIIDLDFIIKRTNHASKILLGIAPQEAVGKKCFQLVHGTSEHIADCPVQKMFQSRQRGQSELLLPDGRWLFVTADPLFDQEGRITGAVHMVRDITERKKLEHAYRDNQERLALASEAANLGLWDWRMDQNLLLANKTFFEITGLTEEETRNFTGKLWADRVHPDCRKQVVSDLESHLKGRTPRAENIGKLLHPVRGWVWLMGIGQVVERDASGAPLRMVGVHQDITESKKAEAERENLIKKLEKALAEVKTLSSLLPICSCCRKVRDDQGYWNQLETYIQKHAHTQFTHSICPACAKIHYPDLDIYPTKK